MTEAEWLGCADPAAALNRVHRKASGRKLRLFACACCRRIKPLLTARGLRTIEGSERIADGVIAPLSLLDDVPESPPSGSHEYGLTIDSHNAISYLIGWLRTRAHYLRVAEQATVASSDVPSEWKAQAALVRDIFGNPFRSVTFDPAWRTDTALALARQMYDAREFSAMPILADALQDAGCDNTDILSHCRDTGATHVRGCWVVDLVLGKE